MRPIHLPWLDKSRSVPALARDLVRPHLNTVTVAPITTTIRGLSTEVALDTDNGLEERCVVACAAVRPWLLHWSSAGAEETLARDLSRDVKRPALQGWGSEVTDVG